MNPYQWLISLVCVLLVIAACESEDPGVMPLATSPKPSGFPNVAGLDFSNRSRDPEPGSLGSLQNRSWGSSNSGTYIIEASGFIESGDAPADLMLLYRDNLVHPSWELQDEGIGADAAWFTWTMRDDSDNLWYCSLVALTAGEGLSRIWLSLYSPALH